MGARSLGVATTEDSGRTWSPMTLPITRGQIGKDLTPQPITSAFRMKTTGSAKGVAAEMA